MELKNISDLVQTTLGIQGDWNEQNGQLTIQSADLVQVCDFLWRNNTTYFDSLSCLTALDNGPENGTLEIIYTLYSIPFHLTLHLRIQIPRLQPDGSLPVVPSVSGIWKSADWHEREAYDLVGVFFDGHPNLIRILLPADWEGHPLRKDYVEQSKYHGIQVKY